MRTESSPTGPHGGDETAPPSLSIAALGWDDGWDTALAAGPAGFEPGRVSRIDRGELTVLAAGGPLRLRAPRQLQLAVGDWVTFGSAAVPGELPGCALAACLVRFEHEHDQGAPEPKRTSPAAFCAPARTRAMRSPRAAFVPTIGCSVRTRTRFPSRTCHSPSRTVTLSPSMV